MLTIKNGKLEGGTLEDLAGKNIRIGKCGSIEGWVGAIVGVTQSPHHGYCLTVNNFNDGLIGIWLRNIEFAEISQF